MLEKQSKVITQAEQTALGISIDYLNKISSNERETADGNLRMEQIGPEIERLRKQRGNGGDIHALTAEISGKQAEADVLADRLAFLHSERLALREGARARLVEVSQAYVSALQRNADAARQELINTIATALLPIVKKCRALGLAGDRLIVNALDGLEIPDPSGARIALVWHGRYTVDEVLDKSLSPAASALLDALAPFGQMEKHLSRIADEVRVEQHNAAQRKLTRERDEGPRYSSPRMGGIEPPPDPERARDAARFPKTEIVPTRGGPASGIRHAHLNDPDAARSLQEMETQQIAP